MTLSVCVFDEVTKEAGVGLVSCVGGFDLRKTCFVVPGIGAGAVQASALLDLRLFDQAQKMMGELLTPATMIEVLRTVNYQRFLSITKGHEVCQFGFVKRMRSGEVLKKTFTGSRCFGEKNDLSGVDGNVHYAMQGNLLRPAVFEAARAIFLSTSDFPFPERILTFLGVGLEAGGDKRSVQTEGALSGIIQVARPNDPVGKPYVDIVDVDSQETLKNLTWRFIRQKVRQERRVNGGRVTDSLRQQLEHFRYLEDHPGYRGYASRVA